MISIEHLAAVQTYTVNEITYNVTAVGATIDFDYQIDDFAENTKVLKGVYEGQIVYFIKSDGAKMTYKPYENLDKNSVAPGESVGITLYFVIKFVGYTDS